MYTNMKEGTNFHYQLKGLKSTYTIPTKIGVVQHWIRKSLKIEGVFSLTEKELNNMIFQFREIYLYFSCLCICRYLSSIFSHGL